MLSKKKRQVSKQQRKAIKRIIWRTINKEKRWLNLNAIHGVYIFLSREIIKTILLFKIHKKRLKICDS